MHIQYRLGMTTRICTADDAPLIADIGRKTYEHTYSHLNNPQVMNSYLEKTFNIDTIRKELRDTNSQTVLITENDRVAGFLKVNFPPSQSDFNREGSMELQRIYVLREFKRRGYGRALIEYAKEMAEKRNCTSIWLSVWEENPEAVSFYEKMGFYKSGTRIFMMAGEEQSDFVLTYDL